MLSFNLSHIFFKSEKLRDTFIKAPTFLKIDTRDGEDAGQIAGHSKQLISKHFPATVSCPSSFSRKRKEDKKQHRRRIRAGKKDAGHSLSHTIALPHPTERPRV